MKRFLILTCLLAAAGAQAATAVADEARRVDDGVYSNEQPVLQQGGAVQAATPDRVAAPASRNPIAELQAAHLAEYRALEQALASATDEAQRRTLENRAAAMKSEHQRAELQALKADALLRNDAAYAARLDEALRLLDTPPAPVATTFVPRDPATGRALEGGVK
jgi:hypothetical protein